MQEGTEAYARMDEWEPEILSMTLSYLYTGDYNDEIMTSKEAQIPSGNLAMLGDNDESENSSKLGDPMIHSTACQTPACLVSVRVYILADYTQIDGLKKLALSKFSVQAQRQFDTQSFLGAVQTTFDHTSHNDLGLRKVVIRLCFENIDLVEQDEDLTAIINANEPVAWSLLKEMHGERRKAWRRVEEADCDNIELRRRLRLTQDNLEETREKLDKICKSVNHYSECRNSSCDKSFWAYIDSHENYVIRCRRCQCRHYPLCH